MNNHKSQRQEDKEPKASNITKCLKSLLMMLRRDKIREQVATILIIQIKVTCHLLVTSTNVKLQS